MLVMLDNKEIILSGSHVPLTPEEKTMLSKDIVELRSALVGLRTKLVDAYGVDSFSDIASEVLKFIEQDPYHKIALAVYGPQGDLSSRAICGNAIFGFTKANKEIN